MPADFLLSSAEPAARCDRQEHQNAANGLDDEPSLALGCWLISCQVVCILESAINLPSKSFRLVTNRKVNLGEICRDAFFCKTPASATFRHWNGTFAESNVSSP